MARHHYGPRDILSFAMSFLDDGVASIDEGEIIRRLFLIQFNMMQKLSADLATNGLQLDYSITDGYRKLRLTLLSSQHPDSDMLLSIGSDLTAADGAWIIAARTLVEQKIALPGEFGTLVCGIERFTDCYRLSCIALAHSNHFKTIEDYTNDLTPGIVFLSLLDFGKTWPISLCVISPRNTISAIETEAIIALKTSLVAAALLPKSG